MDVFPDLEWFLSRTFSSAVYKDVQGGKMAGKRHTEAKRADAEYLASMCVELAKLAQRDGFEFGAYLLEMASLEFAAQGSLKKRRAAGCLNR